MTTTDAYRSDSDQQQEDAPQTDKPKQSRDGHRKRIMRSMGINKYQANLYRSLSQLHPKFKDEWLTMLGKKQTTQTILYCVAKFKIEEQPRAFVFFSNMGSRAAKRWIECKNNPPTINAIARRITKYLAREFPGVPDSHVAAAPHAVVETMEDMENTVAD